MLARAPGGRAADIGSRQGRRHAAESGGRGLRQRALHRVEHELVHRAAVAEAHFDLGRVDVDVDQRRVEVERQHIGREAVAVQHVLVGGADRVHQQLVAHEAPVHVEELAVGARLRCGRQAGVAVQAQRAGAFVDRQARLGKVAAQDVGAALGHLAHVPVVDGAAVVGQAECTSGRASAMRRTTSAQWPYSVCSDFRNLRRAGVLKYRSCTSIVVPNAPDDGATVPRCEPTISQACGGVGGARRDGDGGHGGDRGQRLAAKAEGGHVFEVGQRGDFGGGVAGQRERQLLGRDAAAIVGDRDAFDAAFLEADGDLGGAGVERVFQQFLDHRRRPLDHLAGGNLRNQLVGEGLDRAMGGMGAFIGKLYPARQRRRPIGFRGQTQ
jgi:hypothetical protein